MSGWLVIDEQLPALWREYSFGPGMATTLVVGIGARKLLAVSPGWKLGDAAHDDLREAKPPAVVVFGHGDPLSEPTLGAKLRSVIQASY